MCLRGPLMRERGSEAFFIYLVGVSKRRCFLHAVCRSAVALAIYVSKCFGAEPRSGARARLVASQVSKSAAGRASFGQGAPFPVSGFRTSIGDRSAILGFKRSSAVRTRALWPEPTNASQSTTNETADLQGGGRGPLVDERPWLGTKACPRPTVSFEFATQVLQALSHAWCPRLLRRDPVIVAWAGQEGTLV